MIAIGVSYRTHIKQVIGGLTAIRMAFPVGAGVILDLGCRYRQPAVLCTLGITGCAFTV